ncbi:MAG: transcription termination/antitermination NusG family protein [Caldilineaceae bacterium]
MRSWYLLYTKPQKEQLVSQQLEDRGLETYFPVLRFERGYNRGIRLEPFFPHYLFIHADMMKEWSGDMRWLIGMRSVVHVEGRPTIVPDQVVETVRQRLEPFQDRVLQPGEWLYQPGQRVTVKSGPFAGMEAIFQRGFKGSERVQILLRILGSEIRTELSGYALEAA